MGSACRALPGDNCEGTEVDNQQLVTIIALVVTALKAADKLAELGDLRMRAALQQDAINVLESLPEVTA